MYHVLIPRILVNQLDIFYLVVPVLMVLFLPLALSLSPPRALSCSISLARGRALSLPRSFSSPLFTMTLTMTQNTFYVLVRFTF